MSFLEQTIFDLALFFRQPVEVFVEVVFIKSIQPEDVAGGEAVGETDSGESGALADDASDDLPEREFSGGRGAEGGGDAELPGDVLDEPSCADGGTLFEGDVCFAGAEGNRTKLFLGMDLG